MLKIFFLGFYDFYFEVFNWYFEVFFVFDFFFVVEDFFGKYLVDEGESFFVFVVGWDCDINVV